MRRRVTAPERRARGAVLPARAPARVLMRCYPPRGPPCAKRRRRPPKRGRRSSRRRCVPGSGRAPLRPRLLTGPSARRRRARIRAGTRSSRQWPCACARLQAQAQAQAARARAEEEERAARARVVRPSLLSPAHAACSRRALATQRPSQSPPALVPRHACAFLAPARNGESRRPLVSACMPLGLERERQRAPRALT